jgi:hypothetical protein
VVPNRRHVTTVPTMMPTHVLSGVPESSIFRVGYGILRRPKSEKIP